MATEHPCYVCGDEVQMHPMSEDFGICSGCGAEHQDQAAAGHGYVLDAPSVYAAEHPDGVELGGQRVRIVVIDGVRRVQRYASASSSSGEGWSDGILVSSHAPTQALVELVAAFPTPRADGASYDAAYDAGAGAPAGPESGR